MKQFRMSLGLLALLAFPLVASAAYPDVQPAHENGRAIEYLQEKGIMTGYPNGTFGPDRPLARAELMKILVESSVGTPDASYARSCFSDVQGNEWYATYVCYAKDQGWVSGYPDGTFRPAQEVIVVEGIKMLVNARGYALPNEALFLADWVDEWYAPYVAAASEQYLISGDIIWQEDGLHFDSPLPRKRIAEFLYRALWNDGELMYSWDLDTQRCPVSSIQSVRMSADSAHLGNGQDLYAVTAEGNDCLLARDVNPLSNVGPDLHWLTFAVSPNVNRPWLAGSPSLEPRVVDGKAYFQVLCECDGGTLPGYFELDVHTGRFEEFLAEADLISEDYRYFISVSDSQAIVVYDRQTDRTNTVASYEWPLTLADQSYGPKDGLSGGMGRGEMRLSGDALVYKLYNARQSSRDDVATYEWMDTKRIYLDTFFD